MRSLNAQVDVRFNPSGEKLKEVATYKRPSSVISPTEILPKFNLDSVLQEDAKRMDLGLPFRYGYEFKVKYSTSNSGKWEIKDSIAVWRLRVKSAGAYSLSFHFKKYYLPETASLVIYNEEESFLYGPLTSQQNSEKNKFTTGPVAGDNIIIQLSVSAKLKGKVQLDISRIIHGYVNILPTNSLKSANLSCHNNVACYSSWDDESDAVAKLIMGPGLCSGALVNNTASDYRSFLLTAFHCVDTDADGDYDGNDYDVDDYVFHFHYKSASCSGMYAGYIEYNSSSYLAGWSDSDFALVELDDSPVGNTDIAFLGWDNRDNTPASGTCIHHPMGDIMKISFDYNSLTTNPSVIHWNSGPDSPVSTHWVVGFDNGSAEGGSSGGPLFNQNSRVVGQLHGGSNICPPVTKYFGRFDVSWLGNNTNATQLAHWLDPNNTGNHTTDLLRSPSLNVPDYICYSGTTVSMQDPPSGVTITWGGTNVTYPYGNTGTSVTVRAASSTYSGSGTITASFSVNNNEHTITHPFWLGPPDGYLYPDALIGPSCCLFGSSKNFFDGTPFPLYIEGAEIEWSLYPDDPGITVVPYSTGQVSARVIVYSYATPGTYTLFVATGNDCASSGSAMTSFTVPPQGQSCSGYYLVFTPNPANTETLLSIATSETDDQHVSFDDSEEWDLEVYDGMQNLKLKKEKLKGKNTKIQTGSWKEGVYIVRVKYRDEVLNGKLVVKK